MKSFADIIAEADHLTATHHERAAAITRAHFDNHPEMAYGVNIERRCLPGWWNASRCGNPLVDVPEFNRVWTDPYAKYIAHFRHVVACYKDSVKQRNAIEQQRRASYRPNQVVGRYCTAASA